ncbi:MAG TPA: phosphatase PAP2 family protein [Actinomycetota bacterium]|jgi:tRNA A-37 threonylcarbamoyl transferase component Bud32/membrane-associated phospholipid phosphatase|nr:phosphatase PAP2 family protein [Actinomycetota bacterium]
MDGDAGHVVGTAHDLTPPGSRRGRRRRRPTGEPPPLPRHLESTGFGWMVAAVGLITLTLLVFTAGRYGRGMTFTVVDNWVVQRLAGLRTPGLTSFVRGLGGLIGSLWTVKVLAWATLVVLVVYKRYRHLIVGLISFQVVTLLVLGLSAAVRRPRPLGVALEGSWAGWSMPSRPVAYLSAILVIMLYSLVPKGRWRQLGKWVATGLVTLLGLVRVYLGLDAPSDVLVAAAIGVTIPLLAYRWFTPSEVFPVSYRRGRTAHLDVGGARGEAIRRALADQLGLEIEEVKPFGLSGSAGSTPLRIKVKGEQREILFGKLYARSHLRSDRWYKLGRELLYGRLEDEKPFHSVRRLVQQEDYALHKLHAAGLPTPKPYGFVELTPDREYLLVSEFFDGAVELGEAEVDEGVIDEGLGIIRKLWDAGLAHRDIKPANLLVRDGHMFLIDVAFVEARPSPWRQAVDLANMMLCLALRSDPRQVYERALRQFSVQEISEGFAATRGLAMPSQLRHMLREKGRDLHAEFLDLLPERPTPISIQRFSLRRFGLALTVLLAVLVVAPMFLTWALQTDRTNSSLFTSDVGCSDQEALWLMAQAVPSATLVPCVQLAPPGWSLNDVKAGSGFATIVFDTDRPMQTAAVTVNLTPTCDLAGATEVSSEQPGARRYLRIDRDASPVRVTRSYVFPGGCVSERFTSPSSPERLAAEASTSLGLVSRERLATDLTRRSDGRLHLDP